MNHRRHRFQKTTCLSKRAFPSKTAAEASGQTAYKCPVCRFWHRTGPVTPIRNPVLRFSLICLTIALILRFIFDAVQARGEVVINEPTREIRYAIIQNMLHHGYKVHKLTTSTMYFIYPGVTYYHGVFQCEEQRFKFVLRDRSGAVGIEGFGVCYTYPFSWKYDEHSINKIILDAFPNHP